MPEQIAAPAGEEIEIPIPLGIPHVASLAAHQADGIATVVGDHVPFEQFDDLGRTRVGDGHGVFASCQGRATFVTGVTGNAYSYATRKSPSGFTAISARPRGLA